MEEFGDTVPSADDEMFDALEVTDADLERLEADWLLTPERPALTILQDKYKWESEGFSTAEAAETFERALASAWAVQNSLENSGDILLVSRSGKVLRAIIESYSNLTSLCCWSGIDSLPMLPGDTILRYQDVAAVKETAVQVVYQYVLEWTRAWKLRHKDDIVYRDITLGDVSTHVWVPANDFQGTDVDSLKKLVNYICTKYRNKDVWMKWITIPGKQIYDKLAGCREVEFPQLKTTRAWLAFRDGLYCVYADAFFFYDDPRIKLPPDLAVCAYHNINFNPCYISRATGAPIPEGIPLHPLCEIKTPLFNGILQDQNLCGHTIFWIFAMIGRCLYWDGVLDTWQVLLYLKGRAGTGKSTIVQVVESIYNYSDVATISSNTEPIFGLEPLSKAPLVWLAPEVKADFSMNQVSGVQPCVVPWSQY